MGLFGRDEGIEDGYRRAKDGENPDMTLNGIPQVRKQQGRDSDNGVSRGIFNRISGGQDEKYGDHGNKAKLAGGLLENERSATKTNGNSAGITDKLTGSKDSTRQSEENISSGFKNMVSGKGKRKDKKGRFIRTLGPILMATFGIGGFGTLSFFGQAAMPFSLISQFQGKFDSIGTTAKVRSSKFLKYQSNPGTRTGLSDDVKNFVSSHSKVYQVFTGNNNDYFKISTRQKKKLAQAGITVDTDGATGQSVLKFTGSNNVELTIVPDSSMADVGSNRFFIDDIYESNPEFRSSYFSGAKTWRGSIGAWFDGVSTKFLNYLGVNRGVWAAYKESGASEENLRKFRTTVEETAGDQGIKGSAETAEFEEKTDDRTGESTRTQTGEGTDSLDVDKNSTRQEVSDKAHDFISNKATKLLSAAGQVSGIACMVADVVGAINLIVMGYQTLQIIKVGSTILEGVQKAQVESSKTTPINEIGNSLTMRGDKAYEIADYEATQAANAGEANGTAVLKTVNSSKSAMEAEAISALYANRQANANDASLQSFNIQKSINSIAAAVGSTITAYRACTFAKLGAAAVEGAIQIAEIVGCIASFGIGCVVDAFIEAGRSLALEVAKTLVVTAVTSVLVPFIAGIVTRTIATEVFGEDLGNALYAAVHNYMGGMDLFAGASIASESSYSTFMRGQIDYNNDIARYERENRSPFDYTSQYTFLGTLINKFVIPINIQTGGLVSKFNSFGNIVGKSISSLVPNATALDATIEAREAAAATEKNCPSIADIGGIADAFCNVYVITDMGTMDLDPAEVAYKVSQLDSRNFDISSSDTDVPVINERSRLGNYIVYCGQRQSQFGLADQNIANDFRTISTGSSVGDTVLGAVPVIGSLTDIYNESNVIANFGYVSGEACVTGNAVAVQGTDAGGTETIETSDWSENKYYQRFIQDQRLAENMGLVEKSSVTAFLEKYYEEHPIDNSFEGMLARRSGLTKEQTIATLDIIDAIAFINDYNPNGYSPLNYSEPIPEKLSFENVYENNIGSGTISAIFHSDDSRDRRIRNFAA